MANEVKRFDPDTKSIGCGDFIGICVEDSTGDYVLYSDYAALSQRLEAAEKRVGELESVARAALDWKPELRPYNLNVALSALQPKPKEGR